MKKIIVLALAVCFFFFQACESDLGTVTVTYTEATAIYGNLDDIYNTELNTTAEAIGNPGKIYIAEDFILIGEEEKGIHVIDNTDSSNPQNVSFINVPGNREFFVNGDFLYAESYYDVVKIDISDPKNAVISDRANFVVPLEYTNEAGESLLGFSFEEVTKELDSNSDFYQDVLDNQFVYYDYAQQIIPASAVPSSFAGNSAASSGTVNRITYTKEHVYILGSSTLNIIRDTPGTFEKVDAPNSLFWGNDKETIFPYGDNLFVGSRTSMDIYDITNAEDPQQVYRFDHATSCDPVLPCEEVAYVTLRTADFSPCPGNINALVVVDIENLNAPFQVDEIQMKSPFGMTVSNDKLYVGEGENGLKIFDVTDKKSPQLLKWVEDIQAYDVLPHPTRTDLILIAGPNGLGQYEIDENDTITLESTIQY